MKLNKLPKLHERKQSKMLKILIVGLILSFILGSSLSSAELSSLNQTLTNENTVDAHSAELLQKVIDHTVAEERLVGLQVSAKTGNGETWNGVSGTVDKKRTKVLEINNPIRVGSITKTFTAVIIMHLIEKGYLALDQSIDNWFPGISGSNQITIRNLLNHSSGIPEILGMKMMFVSTINPWKVWKPAEIIQIITSKDLEFSSGSKHKYSNSNYILLGFIAEKVTGRPLQDLYREEILDPLGLKNTYFLPYDCPPVDLVNGYDRSFIPFPGGYVVKKDNTAWSTCAYASGAMASTAQDLMNFYDAIMNKTVVSERSFTAMTAFENSNDKNNTEEYLDRFGFGLFQFNAAYDNTSGNLGMFIGSEALALYHPEKRYVITIVGNISRFHKDRLVQEIIGIINQKT
jgi:D-alanyl-D-alanine carboxypeptidase